jgi:hypothetical protein
VIFHGMFSLQLSLLLILRPLSALCPHLLQGTPRSCARAGTAGALGEQIQLVIFIRHPFSCFAIAQDALCDAHCWLPAMALRHAVRNHTLLAMACLQLNAAQHAARAGCLRAYRGLQPSVHVD